MIESFIKLAIILGTRQTAIDWIKLAKRDLKKIKKNSRMSLNDAYIIGRIEAELITIESDLEEVGTRVTQ